MTKEELAAQLNGRTYRGEIHRHEERAAKDAGLVVVFGASDDLMEFRGAIEDELDAYEGAVALLTREGLLKNECVEGDDCPNFDADRSGVKKIEAVWCADDDTSWSYRTSIPHAAFEIRDDEIEGLYCRGIVFALADLPAEDPR